MCLIWRTGQWDCWLQPYPGASGTWDIMWEGLGATISFSPGAMLCGTCRPFFTHQPQPVTRSLPNQSLFEQTTQLVYFMPHGRLPQMGLGESLSLNETRTQFKAKTLLGWKLSSSVHQGWEESGYGGRDLTISWVTCWDGLAAGRVCPILHSPFPCLQSSTMYWSSMRLPRSQGDASMATALTCKL